MTDHLLESQVELLFSHFIQSSAKHQMENIIVERMEYMGSIGSNCGKEGNGRSDNHPWSRITLRERRTSGGREVFCSIRIGGRGNSRGVDEGRKKRVSRENFHFLPTEHYQEFWSSSRGILLHAEYTRCISLDWSHKRIIHPKASCSVSGDTELLRGNNKKSGHGKHRKNNASHHQVREEYPSASRIS